MAPVRVRHPNGAVTIEVPLDNPSFTVQDLQQEIYSKTQILPSRQILKLGYPPRTLTIIPELPVDSLGIQRGDQIIVSEGSGGISQPPQQGFTPAARPAVQQTSTPASRAPVQAPPSSSGPDHVPMRDGSFLIHRVVPDDNSCLFSSIAIVFEQDIKKAQQMRKIVAEGIKANPETYNEAILGMPPTQYINTISKPSTWGGAIELAIFAQHYGVEIASIDVETGRIDRFSPPSEASAPSNRCLLVYSGIHYDAATVAPMVEAPAEWHQTLFPIASDNEASDPILVAAKKLADILRSKKAFTNTATFDLKCEQCGQGLKGEKEARLHAEQTGHTRFGEY